MIDCPNYCGTEIRRSEEKEHLAKDCINREYTCKFYHLKMTFYHYSSVRNTHPRTVTFNMKILLIET